MNEQHRGAGMRDAQLFENAFEMLSRHGFMGLVLQADEGLALLQLPHDALKFDARSDFPRGQHGRRDDDRHRRKCDLLLHIQPPLTGGISAISFALPRGPSHDWYSSSTATRHASIGAPGA